VSSKKIESTIIESTASAFAALGDPCRLRIVDALRSGSLCVCELQERIGIAPNLLSYHLRVLRNAGVCEASRRGRWMDYRLVDERLEGIRRTIASGVGR
jgi:ArsR family transcriptional regulator